MSIAISCIGGTRLLINHEYLEKFCIDKINEIGKKIREIDAKSIDIPMVRYNLSSKMDVYSEILAIIAQEVAYEREQNNEL